VRFKTTLLLLLLAHTTRGNKLSLQVPDLRQGAARVPRPRGAGRQDLRGMGELKGSSRSSSSICPHLIPIFSSSREDHVICDVFIGITQGVDYLKYDNCNNGDLKPLERSGSQMPFPCPSQRLLPACCDDRIGIVTV